MYCPSPVRSRWSRAASSAASWKRGATKSVNGPKGPIGGRSGYPVGSVIPADGRALRAVSGHRRIRAGLSEQRRAEHDEVRLSRAQRFVVELQPLHRARSERLAHDIGPVDEIEDDLARIWMREIEPHARLPRVDCRERRTVLRQRREAVVRRKQADQVEPFRRLNLDHGGPVVGHDPRGVRARHHPPEVEHLHVVERHDVLGRSWRECCGSARRRPAHRARRPPAPGGAGSAASR